MERNISTKRRQGHIRRDDEASVNGTQAPVEETDDNLNGRGNEREVVFAREERVRAGDVGD